MELCRLKGGVVRRRTYDSRRPAAKIQEPMVAGQSRRDPVGSARNCPKSAPAPHR